MKIDYHEKVMTNSQFKSSDCTHCKRVVDGICRVNGMVPMPIELAARHRKRCGYWWPSGGVENA